MTAEVTPFLVSARKKHLEKTPLKKKLAGVKIHPIFYQKVQHCIQKKRQRDGTGKCKQNKLSI